MLSLFLIPAMRPLKAGLGSPYRRLVLSGVTVRGAWLTVWERGLLVLPWYFGEPLLVPLYSAVMLCGLPAASKAEVVQIAWLPVSVIATQPVMLMPASKKVSVPTPLGLLPLPVTVAVKVTE